MLNLNLNLLLLLHVSSGPSSAVMQRPARDRAEVHTDDFNIGVSSSSVLDNVLDERSSQQMTTTSHDTKVPRVKPPRNSKRCCFSSVLGVRFGGSHLIMHRTIGLTGSALLDP